MSEDFNEDEYKTEQQDKIMLKTTAKGLVQAEVRIGGKMDSNESIDGIITRQKYAFSKLRENFRNLIWQEEEKKEMKNEKLDDDND